MKEYKRKRFFVVATTTMVKHYVIRAQDEDEARMKVELNPNYKSTARDVQTIIDDVELIDWD
jgi:hypothetical protein